MGSLVGTLEDLGLGDILQIVSLSRKSGLLNLIWGEVKGKIFFHDGQVVAAVSSQFKQTIGSVLVQRHALAENREAAVDKVAAAKTDHEAIKRMLTDEFKITAPVVEEALRSHIESVVFHFFTWPEGTFSFELQDIDEDLARLSPLDRAFVLDVGLSPQFLAMEGTRLQDEHRRARVDAPVGPPLRGGSKTGPEPPDRFESSDPAIEEFSEPEITESEPAPPGPARELEDDFSSVSDAVAFYNQQAPAESSPAESAPAESALDLSPEELLPVSRGRRPAVDEDLVPQPSALDEVVTRVATPFQPVVRPSPTPQRIGDIIPAPETMRGLDTPDLILVDDDPFLLKSVAHLLSGRGLRMQLFTEVAPALSRLQGLVDAGERPRAAIVDLIMPDSSGENTLGGLEFLDKGRAMSPGLSIYLMSDYENLPARAKSEQLGAKFFFMKPKSSQLDDDFGSPELVNFVSVLENGLQSESARPVPVPASASAGSDQDEDESINLGEELRREFGEEMSPSSEGDKVVASPGLHMLKTMISELNDPSSSGQITLLVLRFAAEMMNRSVIFLVARNQLAGLGQFGIELNDADPQKHVRKIRVPLNEPSIFREAIQKRLPLKKALKNNKWHQYLVDNLGGIMPKEVFVAPIIAGGKIAAILYGDNVPDDRVIGDTESLEIFLAQAGLAMEKALLERRLREMGSASEGSS